MAIPPRIPLLIAALVPLASPFGAVTVERTAWLMGTRVHVRVEAPTHAAASTASEAALRAMEATEGLLSTWRSDTPLARLNRTPVGRSVAPEAELATLLAEAARWIERTDGAFDPTIGALVDTWGLRDGGRRPSASEVDAARAASGSGAFSIDPATGAVSRHHRGAWLDSGAFGKGAALRAARRALVNHGVESARIELGGQLLVVGARPLVVDVAHPVDRARPVAGIVVEAASVATSGQSERGFELDGVRHGHVLDPRTGRPALAWGSVTVVHADPVAADALATALFVLGPDAGVGLADRLGVPALFVVTAGSEVELRPSAAAADLIHIP